MASYVTTDLKNDQVSTTTNHVNVVGGESIHNVPASGFEAVYQPCSVPLNKNCRSGSDNGLSLNNNCSWEFPRHSRDAPEPLTDSHLTESPGRYSLWSLRQLLLGSPLFSCCRVGSIDANARMTSNQSAIELENLCDNDSPCRQENYIEDPIGSCGIRNGDALIMASKDGGTTKQSLPNTTIPGAGYIDNSNPDEPVWVMMDSKSFCPDAVSEFLNASGDMKIKSLIVANSPLRSIVKLLDESLLTKNISMLKLENCSPTLEQITVIIQKLTELKRLEIIVKDACENGKAEPLMLEDYKKSYEGSEYFEKIRKRFKTSMGIHPQKLKVLKLTYPLIWQCTMVSKVIDTLLEWLELEELYIQASPYAMLLFLLASENHINFENESSWQEFVTLDCKGPLMKSRMSLNVISISCLDLFPLEYLRVSQTHTISANDIFRWCYFCTLGMIDSLSSSDEDGGGSRCLLFPSLNSCTLDLPFVPVSQLREDEFRRPLNTIVEFLAKNNHIQQQVLLNGLRPEKGMENWIKHSVVTIPRSGARIGTTYCSTTLGKNLPIYDDELYSMAFVIVPGEVRLRVSEIIEPHGKRVTYGNWSFDGVKNLHIINEQPSLVSYGMSCITSQFIGLTRLAVEDFTDNYKSIRMGHSGSMEGKHHATLTDSDIQKILRYLTLLEYLHLDCNMSKVTDNGFAGPTDSLYGRLTQGNRCTLATLRNLKYLFLRGFGPKLTDKFAKVAFDKDNCMPNLKELHVFGLGITNYGKDKIRNTFADRKGFIVQL